MSKVIAKLAPAVKNKVRTLPTGPLLTLTVITGLVPVIPMI